MTPIRTSDFNYTLPDSLIAQKPLPVRDQSRLLVLNRGSGEISHRKFSDLLELLRPGDVLVLNNSRVVPARLRGVNGKTGGAFEILLLEENALNDWWVMLRPGRRARMGTRIIFKNGNGKLTSVTATVVEKNSEGHRQLQFAGTSNIADDLPTLGEVPLPPYIVRGAKEDLLEDDERYQTVYAETNGSIAAPTAGLHFTEKLLEKIRSRGVEICKVTLHVGLGTFAPVKTEHPAEHKMHEERFAISSDTAKAINAAKKSGRRVIAVGTTTVRVLESVASQNGGQLVAGRGRTNIFIFPPFTFRVVEGLLTNFHLPRSTLLMLVSAFAAPGQIRGREMVLSAYAEAIRQQYRFYSYGDAMLII